jgi:hypothetical protein
MRMWQQIVLQFSGTRMTLRMSSKYIRDDFLFDLWFLQNFILSHLALVKKLHYSTMFRFNQFRIIIYSTREEGKAFVHANVHEAQLISIMRERK